MVEGRATPIVPVTASARATQTAATRAGLAPSNFLGQAPAGPSQPPSATSLCRFHSGDNSELVDHTHVAGGLRHHAGLVMPFEIKVFGPVVMVTVAHQLTVVDCRRLQVETAAALERGLRAVRIDLSHVPSLGGDALGELQELAHHVAELGGDLRIVSVAPEVASELQQANSEWLLHDARGRKHP
jgi:anti-anti-sigma regulatory factor